MSTPHDAHEALLALQTALGDQTLGLKLGSWEIVVEGLDPALSRRLGLRWGGFVTAPSDRPRLRVRLLPPQGD